MVSIVASDKQQHGIWDLYHLMLDYLTETPVNVLELGVYRGESLNYLANMFKHKESAIFGVDITPPEIQLLPKVSFIHTGQDNPKLAQVLPALDIIIDDASHDPTLTIRSFELLYPKVKPGGWYIIEDWHPSILPDMCNAVHGLLSKHWQTMSVSVMWRKDSQTVAAVALFQKRKS